MFRVSKVNSASCRITFRFCDLYFRVEGKTEHVFVSGGFAEVSDNKLTVLAESAELGENIDVARAEAAKRRAEERLAAKIADTDLVRAHLALQRAVERLHIASQS